MDNNTYQLGIGPANSISTLMMVLSCSKIAPMAVFYRKTEPFRNFALDRMLLFRSGITPLRNTSVSVAICTQLADRPDIIRLFGEQAVEQGSGFLLINKNIRKEV